MVSIKIPKSAEKDENYFMVNDQDALLILMNIANQLAINHVKEPDYEAHVDDDEDDDLLPPMPGA